jgi:hypothetical protein
LPYGQAGQELCLGVTKDHIFLLLTLEGKNIYFAYAGDEKWFIIVKFDYYTWTELEVLIGGGQGPKKNCWYGPVGYLFIYYFFNLFFFSFFFELRVGHAPTGPPNSVHAIMSYFFVLRRISIIIFFIIVWIVNRQKSLFTIYITNYFFIVFSLFFLSLFHTLSIPLSFT